MKRRYRTKKQVRRTKNKSKRLKTRKYSKRRRVSKKKTRGRRRKGGASSSPVPAGPPPQPSLPQQPRTRWRALNCFYAQPCRARDMERGEEYTQLQLPEFTPEYCPVALGPAASVGPLPRHSRLRPATASPRPRSTALPPLPVGGWELDCDRLCCCSVSGHQCSQEDCDNYLAYLACAACMGGAGGLGYVIKVNTE